MKRLSLTPFAIQKSVREIPFIIYKKNSNLASLEYDGPFIEEEKVTSLNAAPSVCAFLGIPIPRESEGLYFKEVFTLLEPNRHLLLWRDLYKYTKPEKKNFFQNQSKII